MQRFILIRVFQAFVSLWVVSMIVFGLGRITGDPTSVLLPFDATEQERLELRADLGLDKPIHVQYGTFINNAFHGDFGESIKWDGYSSMGIVIKRLPATLKLAAVAMIVAVAISLPVGIISAVKRDTIFDYVGKIIALFGQSLPAFWLGLVLMWVFAVQLDWVPTSGRTGWTSYFLPAISIGWFLVAALMRLVRSSMLEVMDSEYIKMARVKGLSEAKVVWKHGLRNASIAPLTFFGIIFGNLLVGSVSIETVYAWPGVGLLAFEAVLARDFPVMQAVVVIFAAIYISMNLVVDVLYAYLDPRIRY
ncbi:MAG: ABC transporter permease [Chloroflexota bacterium]|nr:ABC transporter permease [Chloroflexota bacterium]